MDEGKEEKEIDFLVKQLYDAEELPNDKNGEFKKLFEEYCERYGRIAKEPSMRQHLRRCIKLWFRIEGLEQLITNTKITDKNWYRYNMLYLKMINQWSILQGRMGTTYTSQQYIPVGDKEIEGADEFFQIEDKMKEIMEEKKLIAKQNIKGRNTPGGERNPKYGPPINIKKKKKKEEKDG